MDFVFNWNIFEDNGFEFQNMCADIFKAHGYHVRCMEKGGSDEGRDIIIYKHVPHLIEFDDSPYAWVECKSQINGSPINVSKIKTNLLYVLDGEVNYLIFITNHKFNNEAHNLFVRYNQNSKIPFKIRYIEKDELEQILRETPSVYKKYFDRTGDTNNCIPLIQYPNDVLPIQELEQDIQTNNLGFSHNLNIKNDIKYQDSIQIFDSNTIDIKSNKHQSFKTYINWNKLDCIYVDSYHIRSKIVEIIKNGACVYICGNAGAGKSRLLDEIAKEINKDILRIDISTDYSKSFLDHLLNVLFDIEIEYLNLLPDNVVFDYLSNFVPINNIPIYLSYIKKSSEQNNYDVIIAETSELFSHKVYGKVLFIDNIHNFSFLDYKLFVRINDAKYNIPIIFTAREDEIANKSLSNYLNHISNTRTTSVFNLKELPLTKLITHFLYAICANEDTVSFLSIYKNAENFQQFILSLKLLRLNGFISQNDEGKIFITNGSTDLAYANYKMLYQNITSYFQTRLHCPRIFDILELCAVYGYMFPVELIECQFGQEIKNIDEIVEALINFEFIKEQVDITSSNFLVRFDHELTWQIIYKAIPSLKKIKIHHQIINYIESLGEDSILYQYDQLAHHYECVKNYSKAVEFTYKEGYKRLQKSELHEAYTFFQHTLELIDIVQKQTPMELYDFEANTLIQIIKLQIILYGAGDIAGKAKSLDVLGTMLNNNYYKGYASFYLSKYYFQTDNVKKALMLLERAESFFKNTQYNIEYAETLDFKSVLLKNIGHFEDAKINAEKAIKVFEQISYWNGLSAALANLGAIYLESGHGTQTVNYWLKSLTVAQKTIDIAEICNRIIDYSYILAIYNPDNHEIIAFMEKSIMMAERLQMLPSICRAKINYSNYLFFNNIDDNISKIQELISDAIRISNDINDEYLCLLATFSYYSFQKKCPCYFKINIRAKVIQLLEKIYKSDIEETFNIGDNRIINIVKFMIAENATNINEYESNPSLCQYIERLRHENFFDIEKNNPYLRGDLYMTYY